MFKKFLAILGCFAILSCDLWSSGGEITASPLKAQFSVGSGDNLQTVLVFQLSIPNTVFQKGGRHFEAGTVDDLRELFTSNFSKQMGSVMTDLSAKMAEMIDNVEYKTSGLITQFSDSVLGANVTNADTFWKDIGDNTMKIRQVFFTQTDQMHSCSQDFMKNSGELKYALCVAVAWAGKLNVSVETIAPLYELYREILGKEPSKEGAIELVKANAEGWKVFPEEFLTLIEGGE